MCSSTASYKTEMTEDEDVAEGITSRVGEEILLQTFVNTLFSKKYLAHAHAVRLFESQFGSKKVPKGIDSQKGGYGCSEVLHCAN